MFGVPCDPSAYRVVVRNEADLADDAAHRKMIAVVIIHTKKGVRERSACECVAIDTSFADQCRDGGKDVGFDADLFHNVVNRYE